MLETLRRVILEYQDLPLVTGVPRRVDIRPISGKATVCIGVRRGGKSTFMFQIMQKLLSDGVARQNILYLNFFDDRLYELHHEPLDLIIEAYYSIYPEKKNSEKIYIFFDEIQVIPRWEQFVDRLMRTEKCELFITGSSAQMLSKEIATQMRGRAITWEMFPFSFQEFLDYKGIDATGILTMKRRLTIQKAFDEFWETGGFPETVSLDHHQRIKVHQEYFNAVLFRDLVERHNVSNPRVITELAHRLVDNAGSLYSINSLTGQLKSLGHMTSKTAVADYLEWFEDAYFLYSVRIFDASIARANTNPKKIYCIDHALATSVASGILLNSGHLLENLVFIALRRITPEIFYHKTKTSKEVDFVAQLSRRNRMLVQVCDAITDPQTRKRETAALIEAMDELKLSTGTIVTRNQQERIEVDDTKTINVTPIWRFLLDAEDLARA